MGFLSYGQSLAVSKELFEKHQMLFERFVERSHLTLNLICDESEQLKLPADSQLVLFDDWNLLESLDAIRKRECSQALLVYVDETRLQASHPVVEKWPVGQLDAWLGTVDGLGPTTSAPNTIGTALSPHISLLRFLRSERSFFIDCVNEPTT